MISYQQQYYDITKRLIEQPHKIGSSRIGDMNSRFCESMRIDLKTELPIMDIKWIKFENVVHELLWMLRGNTNIKYLIENDCHIWTDDAYRYYKDEFSPHRHREKTKQLELFDLEMSRSTFKEKVLNEEIGYAYENYMPFKYGNMGKIYGYQWRSFCDETDQVEIVLDKLKNNPDDRRMIITGHNPNDLENGEVGLPSCHNYMQFYTTINEDGSRDLHTFCNIRSNDWFLGQPYNVVQYALITHIFAKLVGMGVGELVINAVDAHLYHEHFEPAKEWLRRYEELPYKDTYCKAELNIIYRDQQIVDYFVADDFELSNYNPQPYIKAKLLT